MRPLSILCLLFLSACASTHKMSEEEKSVVVHKGSFSSEGCVVKGALREDVPTYFGADSYSIDHSGDALRKAAVKLGANTVVMNHTSGVGGTALGIAYLCKR
jgi:hypothetical protein